MQYMPFAPFCTQPRAEFAFALIQNEIVIAYERERDFLSAPKAYVILRANFTDEPVMTLGNCQLNDEQWDALQQSPHGIYFFENTFDADNNPLCIFYSATQLLELQSATLEKITEIYHQPSVSEALIHFLGRT